MGSGRDRGARITGETLRRLLEEGDPTSRAPGRGRPTDAALRDLAAALNIAASAPAAPTREQAAQEVAAMAAFRDAHSVTGVGDRPHRRAPRHHVSRARAAVLAGVVAAVLGGGAALAAAGGDVPFLGAGPDGTESSPSAAPEEPGAAVVPGSSTPPDGPTPSAPVLTPSAPAASSDEETDDGAVVSGGSFADEPAGAGASTAAGVGEKALRSLCAAHARSPDLAPRTLVEAAGGPGRVGAYCAELRAAPATGTGPGNGAAGKDASGKDVRTATPDPGLAPVAPDDLFTGENRGQVGELTR